MQRIGAPSSSSAWRNSARASSIPDRDPNTALHTELSDREFQVFLRLAKGATVSDIGNALSLSIKTVSTYRTRIMEKMGLQSNSDLTYYAMKNNLLD